jgi:hypothetical protein
MATSGPVLSSTIIQGPIIDPKSGRLTSEGVQWFQNVGRIVNAAFNQQTQLKGQIGPTAILTGRTAGLSTMLSNISNAGNVAPAAIAGPGTVSPAVLPLASLGVRGAIQLANPVAHEWIDSIAATGIPHQSQPAFADVSGQALAAQVPNLSALNGGVTGLQLPLPTTSLIGGVEAVNAIAHQWLASIDTSGVPHLTQPAAADLSNGTTGSGGGVVLATGPTIASPTMSSPSVSNGIIGSGASTTVTALATATVLAGTGANSGILSFRDNTLGGSAIFLIDPNAGAALIVSQITGLAAAGDVLWNGTNWTVTLTGGAVPRTLAWILLAQ